MSNLSFSKFRILSDLFGQYQPLVIIIKLWQSLFKDKYVILLTLLHANLVVLAVATSSW